MLSTIFSLLALRTACVTGDRSEVLWNDGWLFHLGDTTDVPFLPPTPQEAAKFPIDLTSSFIHGLTDTPSGNTSANACASVCASNMSCQAWQYCPQLLSPTTCGPPTALSEAPCTFPVPTNDVQIDGLHSASASSESECAQACCSDSTCVVYQWCGESGACASQGKNACWVGSLGGSTSPVQGWLSRARNVTLGPSCQTGLLADYGPGNWQSSGAENWVGAARLAPPALPFQATGPASIGFDDSTWEPLMLPHDYMARLAPTSVNATPHQNEHGSIPFSNGWYRKHFSVPLDASLVRLYFDGAYRSAYVFLGGCLVGQHEEGYTGFSLWLHNVSGCPLNLGPASTNVLSVYLASTIYTYELWGYEGAGITRDVTLITHTSPTTIAPWGVVAGGEVAGPVEAFQGKDGPLFAPAVVSPTVDVANGEAGSGGAGASSTFVLTATVIAPDGITVVGVSTTQGIELPSGGWIRLLPPPILLNNASLWSPSNSPTAPKRPLYTLVTSLTSTTGVLLDSTNTTFGIRRVVFDPSSGLTVNGFPTKLRGLSAHQDFAGTGTFVPPNVQAYRIQRALDIGANAWRCAHNPIDSRLLEEADARGVMVWEENRFLRDFDVYVQDAGDMVARDRNHPSVLMWSLCNENGCGETPGYESAPAGELPGSSLAERFKAHMKTLDATRPITSNSHNTLGEQGSIFYAMDVIGLTYDPGSLDKIHAALPLVPVMNGESCSCQSDRVDEDASGVMGCSSGCWAPADSRVWDAGAFVWSFTDYRGETSWPNVVSFYGILDLCGFDKPVSDWYKTWWGDAAGWEGSEKAVVASPAWAPPASGGQQLTITALCSTPNATLSLAVNGAPFGSPVSIPHLGFATWRGVTYEAGNYSVTARDSSGGVVGTFVSVSPGVATALKVTLDWAGSGSGGAVVGGRRDAALLGVSVVDAVGTVVVGARHNITFTIEGPGELLGLGNGDHTNHLPGQGISTIPAYSGRARGVVRGLQASGQPMTVTVSADGLSSDKLVINVV